MFLETQCSYVLQILQFQIKFFFFFEIGRKSNHNLSIIMKLHILILATILSLSAKTNSQGIDGTYVFVIIITKFKACSQKRLKTDLFLKIFEIYNILMKFEKKIEFIRRQRRL